MSVIKLTPKQEKFCQNIVSGMNYIESYMDAYNCNSKSAANTESVKLMKRDDITERVKQLQKPVLNLMENRAINVKLERTNYIKERIRICEQNNDEQSIIRYTDMLNKIDSLYKDDNRPETEQNTLDNIDTNKLKALLNA